MPAHLPPVWEIDGLILNTARDTSGVRDAEGIQWILTEDSEPMASAEPTTEYADKFQRIGSTWIPGQQKKGGGTLVIRGYARRDDWAARDRAMLRAMALCADVSTTYPLIYRGDGGSLVQYITREGEILPKIIDAQHPGFEISMQFNAPDPRRYDLEWTKLVTTVPQNSTTGLDFVTGGGLDFAAGGGAGLDFGPAGSAGTILLDNTRGTAPSAPILRLDGRLDTPVLAVAGGSIRYNAVLDPGRFIDINPDDPSFLLDGATSAGYLASPAQWDAFVVPKGETLTIGLAHSGPSTDLGTLTCWFRAAYW
ncbi:hypothetical protein ACWEOE_28885 [Amycolatopsis sp. NPDC004368]